VQHRLCAIKDTEKEVAAEKERTRYCIDRSAQRDCSSSKAGPRQPAAEKKKEGTAYIARAGKKGRRSRTVEKKDLKSQRGFGKLMKKGKVL